ncbi:MAG: GNAT family N-acetyltransferase [Cyanobacteria bacterium P01_A01_bin.123]
MTPPQITFRLADGSDVPALAQLFKETVLAIAPQKYSPEQTQAWAAFAAAGDPFHRFIVEAITYVAEDNTGIAGFAGIASDGHVTATYVRHDRIRQGIGSQLMHHIFEYAKKHHIQRLYSEASEFSLGLFKKFGFQQYDTEVVERHGVTFTRYLMEYYL